MTPLPKLGLGLGLRHPHFDHILSEWPKVEWFEAISENFIHSHGRPGHVLRQIAERYPVVLHGVSMSIGSTDPLNRDYLRDLAALANTVGAAWVSDHLCWTGVHGLNSHDLLPLPLNEASLAHVIERVRIVQDILERPLVLENPSTYVSFAQSSLDEPAFFRELGEATDCRFLLDVNNVFVTCFNAGKDPLAYLDAFPFERVVQLHLAGHQHCATHIVDTHDQPVAPEVWALFHKAWARSEGASTLLEWDGDIPAFDRCHAELLLARRYMDTLEQAGELGPVLADTRRSVADESISTPVDFLIAPAMASASLEHP